MIEGAVILFILALKAVMLKFEKDQTIEQANYQSRVPMSTIHPNYRLIKKIYKFFFERVFFLLTFMNTFLVIFSIANEITLNDSTDQVATTSANTFFSLVAGIIVLGFLFMVIINGFYPKLNIFPMFMNTKYPVYYVFYNSVLMAIIMSFYNQKATPYVLAAATIINLVILIYWKPYPEAIHNFTIAFEQGIILLAIFLYLF